MRYVMLTAVAGSLLVSGCATGNRTGNNAVRGAAIGTGIGALAGGVIGGGTGGAMAGAAVGAVAGGAAGALITKQQPRAYYRDTRGYCYYVDRNGKPTYDAKARC